MTLDGCDGNHFDGLTFSGTDHTGPLASQFLQILPIAVEKVGRIRTD